MTISEMLEHIKWQLEEYQREYEKLTAESTDWESKVYELQDRINKALDKLYCYGEVFDSKILQQFQKEMLEILQGEDK